jgi:hypothetical protein
MAQPRNYSLAALLIFFTISFGTYVSAVAAASEDEVELNLKQEEAELNIQDPAVSNSPTAKHASEIPVEVKPPKSAQHAQVDTSLMITDERDYSGMGEVAVERSEDYTLPYRERRGKTGVLFSLNSEKVAISEFFSLLDDTHIDTAYGGNELSLLGLELGYEYNFSLGSVYLIGAYGSGKKSNTESGNSRTLELTKKSLSVGYAANVLFSEPWIVPYGQVGVHQFSVSEQKNALSDSSSTDMALNYRFGLLFQLNWIEKSIDSSTHSEGLRSSGLENTFLDLYFTWYQPSANLFDPADPTGTASADPDLRSEGALGLALKMEF